MPHEKAVAIIVESKGTHFDPDMVDAFVELQDEFRAIAQRFADTDTDMAKKKEQLDRLSGDAG
jgi:putative two-component system response regulator